jgi:hypothetical protein
MEEPPWPPYDSAWLPEIPQPQPLNFVEYTQQLLPAVLLIALSAMFSGLTLGLLSLDTIGLQVIIESGARLPVCGTEFFCEASRCAAHIYKPRARKLDRTLPVASQRITRSKFTRCGSKAICC